MGDGSSVKLEDVDVWTVSRSEEDGRHVAIIRKSSSSASVVCVDWSLVAEPDVGPES